MHEPQELTNFTDFLTVEDRKIAPRKLFFEGDSGLLSAGLKVSIVGSRNASKEGLMRARSVAMKLVEKGAVIVSGLADGVDTVAHKTAIEKGGRTIGVIGTPLSISYPVKNRELQRHIAADHLLVSQFEEGSRVYQSNFPKRNKTMALISNATIIIEAGEKSGTKHQGWEALKLGRKLLIMENVISSANVSWALKMLEYGAQVVSRENFDRLVDDIPSFSPEELELF